MMNENFLQYLWQFRLFYKDGLSTTEGKSLQVIRAGIPNQHAGPDFFDARLIIDGTAWAGNVEIHIRASDWQHHRHHLDSTYNNCILHVVYEADSITIAQDGSLIPAFEIKNKFPAYLWNNYLALLGTKGWVSCQHRLREIEPVTWTHWFDRLVVERLESKVIRIQESLSVLKNDWQEVFHQFLMKNFGFQVNALPFEMLSRVLPFRILIRHQDRPEQLEALLLGCSGLLSSSYSDSYVTGLYREYLALSRLYSLKNLSGELWKFLRLRPGNFPTIRLAQVADLYHRHDDLFRLLMEDCSLPDMLKILAARASSYWDTHYIPGKESPVRPKILGSDSSENLIINTVVPFLFAWGKWKDSPVHCDRALQILERLSPENNYITRGWVTAGVKAQNALQSQALLQLRNDHCLEKKCLNCGIGTRLINSLP